MSRLVGLDLIRVFAAGVVLLKHAGELPGRTPTAIKDAIARLEAGGTGFFLVLSGFIITTLLLRDVEQGKYSVRRFAEKRAARLLPLHAVFLLVASILMLTGVAQEDWLGVLASLTFTGNFFLASGWTVHHTWSLALEWQFLTLLVITYHFGGKRALLVGSLALVALLPVVRCWSPGTWQHSDMLAWGILAAFVQRRSQASWRVATWPAAILLLGLSVGLTGETRGWLCPTLQCSGAAALVLALVNQPRSWLTRLGETRLVKYLGSLTFSIYIWQQVLLDATLQLPLFSALLAIVALAALSKQYVEVPGAELMERWYRRERASVVAANVVSKP